MQIELKSLLNTINNVYNIWARLLTYGASFLFAFEVTIMAIWKINLLIILVAGFLGAYINFLLSKKFPKRFPLWNINIRNIVFPPYSSFFMSAALFIFSGHFLFSNFQIVWQESLTKALPSVITEIALWFVGAPIALGLIFVPSLLLLIYLTKKTKEITFLKLLPVLFLSTTIAYFVGALLDNRGFHLFAEKVVPLFLGFLPISWFYELFVSSLFPKESIQVLFDKLKHVLTSLP